MEKRTKIIVIVASLLVLVVILALSLGLHLSRSSSSSSIKLEVWPHPEDNSDVPLIQYSTNNAGSWSTWNNRLTEFLKEYRSNALQPRPSTAANLIACSYGKAGFREDQVCDVPLDSYYPCTLNTNFKETSPCLFFRLNKISNWTPVPFNNTVTGLPEKMPEDLQRYIENVRNAPEANNVWISCEGVDPADKEYIGPVRYIPRRGFPVYYFPYANQEGYLSPLVAVYFEKPRTGVLIKIVCTAWAKNIKNDKDEQQGTVHFMLQVD